MVFEERKYRENFKSEGLFGFEIVENETDLFIFADKDLKEKAMSAVLKCREELQKFILEHNEFATTFSPYKVPFNSPPLVSNMAWAAKKANVGPMAAVAGAIAERVGLELLKYSKDVIVENGGDIFIKTSKTRLVGIFAGKSIFSEKLALEIDPNDTPLGICTSSGTVGHSFSYGKADAVVVLAKSASLADAAATAIANVVQDVKTIEDGLALSKKIKGLRGVLIIKDDQMGILGKIKIVKI